MQFIRLFCMFVFNLYFSAYKRQISLVFFLEFSRWHANFGSNDSTVGCRIVQRIFYELVVYGGNIANLSDIMNENKTVLSAYTFIINSQRFRPRTVDTFS